MPLILIFLAILIATLGIIWASGAFFINLDRKAGPPIGAPIICLGVLVGLVGAGFFMKFMWAEEPGGWGYGSLANAMLMTISPPYVLPGYWVVLGSGCLAKAFMRDCRPIRNQAIGRTVLFWMIPGFIVGNHLSSVVARNGLESKAEKWATFIVDGRTHPTADELLEIENNPEIRGPLITAITWGSHDYAAAWKFFWEPLAAKSPHAYRELLLRHGTNAAQIREAIATTEKWDRGSFRLIQDNPSFNHSPLATELMAVAVLDRFELTDEEIRNRLKHSLGSGRLQLPEPYWQLRQWDRLARTGDPEFKPDAFRQWLQSPENAEFREDLKIRIHGQSSEVSNLIDPQVLAILVVDGGMSAGAALTIGAKVPWSGHDWRQFLACPPGNPMIDHYQDWIDGLGASYMQVPSPLLFVSTENPDFNEAAKAQLKADYRISMFDEWKRKLEQGIRVP